MIAMTNILGFPFEQGPSTFQVYSPPPPAKTVHHHPAHCNTIQQSHHQYQDGSTTKTIKSEPVWNDQPCPNIEINNGILCASEGGFGRRGRNSRGADHRRLTLAINLRANYELKNQPTSDSQGFQQYPGPAVDYRSPAQRAHRKKQLFLTQKLLDLKKKSNMFHQEFLPGGTGEMSPLGSPFDSPLPIRGEVLPFLALSGQTVSGGQVGIGEWEVDLQDLVNGDDPSFLESLYSGQVLEKPAPDELSRTHLADFGHRDSWANTPISLPPTPQGTSPNSPADMFLPHPSATPILMLQQQPTTPPFQPNPLTPASLNPSESDDDGEQAKLEEILSFLKDDGHPPSATPCQNMPFQSTPDTYLSGSSDDCSSMHSSLHSGPTTPLSPFSLPPSGTATPMASASQTCLSRTTPAFPPEEFFLPHSPVVPLYQPADQEASDEQTDFSRKRQRSDSSCPQPQRKRRFSSSSKKERKKEQNKTAALKYRQKKKEEKSKVDVLLQEEEERNKRLRSEVGALEAEIYYVKKLWDEFQKTKSAQMSQQS